MALRRRHLEHGLTRKEVQRSRGSTRDIAAKKARSVRRSLGRPALRGQDLQLVAQDEYLDLAIASLCSGWHEAEHAADDQ